MPLELLIERWFGLGCLAFGVSHLIFPGQWAAVFFPLREHRASGLLLATFTMPLGLAIALAHNVWVWGIPVVVTVVGWLMVAKSLVYLLFPTAPQRLMESEQRLHSSFRVAGGAMVLAGVLVAYDSFRMSW